ncbi:MAG: hypothetical protein ACI8Y4_000113 [Candidatus Poriferisodalaceae bacterium]
MRVEDDAGWLRSQPTDPQRFSVTGMGADYALVDLRTLELTSLPAELSGSRPTVSPNGEWLAGAVADSNNLWISRPDEPAELASLLKIPPGFELISFVWLGPSKLRASIESAQGCVATVELVAGISDLEFVAVAATRLIGLGTEALLLGTSEAGGSPTFFSADSDPFASVRHTSDYAIFHNPNGTSGSLGLAASIPGNGVVDGRVVLPDFGGFFSADGLRMARSGLSVVSVRDTDINHIVAVDAGEISRLHSYDGYGLAVPSPDGRQVLYVEGEPADEFVDLMAFDRESGTG